MSCDLAFSVCATEMWALKGPASIEDSGSVTTEVLSQYLKCSNSEPRGGCHLYLVFNWNLERRRLGGALARLGPFVWATAMKVPICF